jgi:hypothetical protein
LRRAFINPGGFHPHYWAKTAQYRFDASKYIYFGEKAIGINIEEMRVLPDIITVVPFRSSLRTTIIRKIDRVNCYNIRHRPRRVK